MSKFTINDLPPAVREQAQRQISRQLGAGNKTITQPGTGNTGREMRAGEKPASRPLTTWYRVSARSEQVITIQVIDFKPATATLPNRLLALDEHGAEVVHAWEDDDSVRYFANRTEGHNWQIGWLGGEINRLTQMRDRILQNP